MTPQKQNIGTSVALGFFDGLHIGHRKVLGSALKNAEFYSLRPTVLLFDVHPREFITGQKMQRLLSDKDEEQMLKEAGFEIYRISFAKVRELSPEAFFNEILLKELGARSLSCGFNYSFGKNGEGNSDVLLSLCKKNSLNCTVVPEVKLNGETVSSSAVKESLSNGDVKKASAMLGRNYSIDGEVIHGDARGRTLGFPTANQAINKNLVCPKYGVYESRIISGGKSYACITNIGIRPTYKLSSPIAETNIINFGGDLYGKEIKTELIRYIRGEKLFSSAKELEEQLKKDISQVKADV